MAAVPFEEETPAGPSSPKKSKIDDGYDEWTCDVADDSGLGMAGAVAEDVTARVDEELERYLREAKPTTTENLLKWWNTKVRLVLKRLCPISN